MADSTLIFQAFSPTGGLKVIFQREKILNFFPHDYHPGQLFIMSFLILPLKGKRTNLKREL
jgi:hypothetical protein